MDTYATLNDALVNLFRDVMTLEEEAIISQEYQEMCIRDSNKCGQPIYVEDVKNNYYVCPKCGGYFRVHAYRRIEMLIDEGTFEEWNKEMEFSNPLDFPGYEKKVLAAKEKTKLNEAIVTGKGKIEGFEAAVGAVSYTHLDVYKRQGYDQIFRTIIYRNFGYVGNLYFLPTVGAVFAEYDLRRLI